MRMHRAMVGAIRSVVTGVMTRSALMPAPAMAMGNCVKDATDTSLCWVSSFITRQPGDTSMMMSPQRCGWKALRVFSLCALWHGHYLLRAAGGFAYAYLSGFQQLVVQEYLVAEGGLHVVALPPDGS